VCRSSKSLNAAAGPLEVVLRGVENSDSRVRMNAVTAGLRLAQDGIITSQHAADIIAGRLEDIDVNGHVQQASMAALGNLGEHAAPHIATLVAASGNEETDIDVRIKGMRTLVILAKFIPPTVTADYIAEVKHWTEDIIFRSTADEVLRAMERAGFIQRSDVDVHGHQGSADRDVLRLWMHGVWTENEADIHDMDFDGCLALEELWETNGASTEWEGIIFGDKCDAVTARRVVSIHLGGKLTESEKVPAQIGELDALTSLWLDDNSLTEVPVALGGLSSLSELFLNRNQLDKLPPELGALHSLTELQVDRNWLTEVPAELGGLSSLKKLWLQGNLLIKLPPEIGRLLSVTELYLTNNILADVPVELGQLVALEVLHLGRNRLTHVPVELGVLRSLREFRLDQNELTGVPAALGRISSLEKLWLQDNKIASVSAEFARLRERGGELILDDGVTIQLA